MYVGSGGKPFVDAANGLGMCGDRLERRLRRQPDQLRLRRPDAVLRGELAHDVPDQPQGGDLEVEEVHRDLGTGRMASFGLVDLEAVRLELRQSPAGFADPPCDPLGEIDVVGVEIDVVGDEERARADRHSPGGWVESCRAEVRLAAALTDLLLEPLVLTAPNVGQALAVGASSGASVEVDGQVEARRDPLPEASGEVDHLVHGRRPERDEGDDVDRADARMLTLVGVHVDLVDRRCKEPLERLADRGVLAGHREDRAVVAGVARAVEEGDLGDGRDRIGKPVDDVDPAALGDVRDRLDEHPLMLLGAARRRWPTAQRSSSIGTWTPRSRATSIARS